MQAMYAIKGGWVGQAFALASSNDSGGRKSRIRRSKEERKTMVESFIKKYQKLNNGNFPSLNLTHKEVGGSFYTVREIVREIIQENRVLGPAKFHLEEQNYKLLEKFPLGSIAVEPQICLSPSEETHVTSPMTLYQYHRKTQEDISNSNGQLCGSENQRLLLDNEKIVNGSDVVMEEVFNSDGPPGTQAISDDNQINAEQLSISNVQFDEPNHQEVNNEEISSVSVTIQEDEESDEPILVSAMPIPCQEISQEHDQETIKEQVLCSAAEYAGNGHLVSNDDEEVVSEISQASEKANECGEPIDTKDAAEDTLDSALVQTNDLEVSNGRAGLKADVLVEKFPLRPFAKTIHDFEVPLSEQYNISKTSEAKGIDCGSTNSSNLMNVEDVEDLAGARLEKISEPLQEKTVLSVGDSLLESSELSTTKETLEAQISTLVAEKPVNVTEKIKNEKNINTVDSSIACGQPVPEESTSSKGQIRNQHDSSKRKESSSTLNRINLETWEGTSSKPAGPESNPLLALFKAFVSAFVKFWTE